MSKHKNYGFVGKYSLLTGVTIYNKSVARAQKKVLHLM